MYVIRTFKSPIQYLAADKTLTDNINRAAKYSSKQMAVNDFFKTDFLSKDFTIVKI